MRKDFPLYCAERRVAPIASFTRISKEPILERGVITETDVIIIMDETLLDDNTAYPCEIDVISSPAINSSANKPLRKMGNWLVFKPVWDYDICMSAMYDMCSKMSRRLYYS